MGDSTRLVRTNLYLSETIWLMLRQAALAGASTAQEIINEEVAQFLSERPPNIQVTLHRQTDKDELRKPRTIRFRSEIWLNLQQVAESEQFSVSSLVEALLEIRFKPSETEEVSESVQDNQAPPRYITSGGRTYDLGENPILIDSQGKFSRKSGEQ